MKITLTAAGPSTATLTGETLNDQRAWSAAYDLQIEAETQIQTVTKPRASYATLRDLGGLGTVISFKTRRMFSDADAAAEYCTQLAAIAQAGTLNLITASGTRVMHNAVVDKPRAVPMGPSVIVSYTARGGAITSS